MKILVTGAKGFIGKNLVAELHNQNYTDILEYDLDTNKGNLDAYCKDAEFIFHLAGVNRPQNQEEFMQGNFGFTSTLLKNLKQHNNSSPIMIASSTQASMDNPYGQSKKAGEDLMLAYEKETKAPVYIYRFPNVFGKWCRPNYNSAVATFCDNIASARPIQINDRKTEMNLIYIDDLVEELINALKGKANKKDNYYAVPTVYTISLGEIADLLISFKESRLDLGVPNMADPFTKKLYSTYLSYLPKDKFAYPLKMNIDNRGSFTEFIRTPEHGQVSVNISKPGITKGNHWHHTKNEKFLVVKGEGIIRFRKIDENDIIDYRVTGEKLEVIDIPTGYTHNIENLGDDDMITIMWANEAFDPQKPDTYYLEV
ncbi:capsular polysaccharide biosynthesis protein CapF [Acetobacterium bakii]|uniref:Capsular biosynthesis protein n=1 Tax=Acetobacterium bakii TaxID=52689 RepID=A0A0L6U2F7_9FIRM|nr:capsular polysaccharide biosynthesis protein CapF [Acetobacterium bakii]KNZ42527.1 capsular biosynthesis protein [Acetobacterium bakii]